MADEIFDDSGLSGILGDSVGSRQASEWETDLLGSLTESELEDLASEPKPDAVRMASLQDEPESDELEREIMRDVNRSGLDGHDISDSLLVRGDCDGWGEKDAEIRKFVTAKLYEGQSPKQIIGLLRLMYHPARAEAFWKARGDEALSKYGRLGFLYVDATDFRNDGEMDKALGGQRKMGQMALEAIKPAARCGDCTLNKGGFCMRYNLVLDDSPSVKNARQARRILNKFARRSEATDLQVAATMDKIDAIEADPKSDSAEYDAAVSEFLTVAGRPSRAAKGETARARMTGATSDASRPNPVHDVEIEAFVLEKLARKAQAGFPELRGATMAAFGERRAKAWFRSNRGSVSLMMEEAAQSKASASEAATQDRTMDAVQEALLGRYGERRTAKFLATRGSDPAIYADLLAKPDTETRRIATGRQMPRAMPDRSRPRAIGHLDDELRQAAGRAAERGIPEAGVRAGLAKLFGKRRAEAFDRYCPGEIGDMVLRASLGFGSADADGFRLLEKSLEETDGNVSAAIGALRRKLGRSRTAKLLSEHPRVEAVLAVVSRTHGMASAQASDRRVGGTGSMVRDLRPPVNYEALAKEVVAAATEDLEMLPSPLPPAQVDPTLVAQPSMDDTELSYARDLDDLPEPVL